MTFVVVVVVVVANLVTFDVRVFGFVAKRWSSCEPRIL